MKRAFGVLGLTALCVACGGKPPLNSGIVIERQHHSAYDSTMMVCSAYGKYGCTVYVPIIEHHPEEWRVHLRETPGRYTSWRTVSEAKYESCSVGSQCTVR